MRTLGWLLLAAALLAALGGCATRTASDAFTFSRTLESGETRVYPALIERPAPREANGSSVLLIGGGYGWDLHWTMPGWYEAEGERVWLTLDGESTRDADRIAGRLLGEGFTVLRFSSIFEGDPKLDMEKGMMTPVGVPESFALTRDAIDAFRGRGGFDPGRLVLLGHSLGAARAAVVADAEDVAGFVLLAGAYVSPTRVFPTELAAAALERHGAADGEGVVSLDAVNAEDRAEAIDRDGDGLLRGWELAAWDRSAGAIDVDDAEDVWIAGERWPSAGLLELDVPVLAVFGGLDPISVHGPWLEHAGESGALSSCTVRYFAELGHNLGEEREGRTGPISDDVLDAVASWLEAEIAGRAKDRRRASP